MQQSFHLLPVRPNNYSVDARDQAKKTVVEKNLGSLHKHHQVSSALATNV